MDSFFFWKVQLITVLYLICYSYTSWSMVHLSKAVCRVSIFRVRLVFIKLYIFVQKKKDRLSCYNSLKKKKIIEKHHIVLFPYLWILSCNKFEKFENSRISLWVGTRQKLTWRWFFKFKKSKFWVHHFLSIVTFK